MCWDFPSPAISSAARKNYIIWSADVCNLSLLTDILFSTPIYAMTQISNCSNKHHCVFFSDGSVGDTYSHIRWNKFDDAKPWHVDGGREKCDRKAMARATREEKKRDNRYIDRNKANNSSLLEAWAFGNIWNKTIKKNSLRDDRLETGRSRTTTHWICA